MVLKKSVILAFLIFLGILAYFGISSLLRDNGDEASGAKGVQTVLQSEAGKSEDLPKVITRELFAEQHPVYLSLKGRTAPNRTVIVRSATTGNVVTAPSLEGKIVANGALLCRLDIETRQARVLEAEALLEAQRQEFDAATHLVEKNLAPTNRLNTAKANLDAAEASLKAAKTELNRTDIRAPFSGVFETRMAERGDFLSPGGACGMIADLDPIQIEAEVTEDYVIALKQGTSVDVSILGAPPRQGEISYIARTSSNATRTFKIEASLENADGAISAGLTSDIRVKLGEALATPISRGLLTLHDDGRLGVRHVNDENVVVFSEITVIDDTGDAIWVTGLNDRVSVVSIGQEYISEGAQVVTVPETTIEHAP